MLASLDVYKIISYVEQHFSVSVSFSLSVCMLQLEKRLADFG